MHLKIILTTMTFAVSTACFAGTEFFSTLGQPADIIHSVADRDSVDALLQGDDAVLGCRQAILKSICLLDQMPTGNTEPKCQGGGEPYATVFEQLHDQFPPALQRMFCSVKRIYVLKNFFGTAFAGLIYDADHKPIGAQMGIRQSIIDERLSLQKWASWKEQLSFGGVADSYTITPGLPTIDTHSDAAVNDLLYFVLAHEFGHMFDFGNAVNQFKCPTKTFSGPEDAECPAVNNTWSAISWQSTWTPAAANRFSFRKSLCFYSCGDEAMTSVAAPDVYRGLARSNFISNYAATNPWDDFADSLAYYLSDQNLHTKYIIAAHQGVSFDIMDKLHSRKFQEKYTYITKFLAKTDIKYP